MSEHANSTIRITHSYAEGTLLDGTSKSDLPIIREVLRTYAWKWGRTIGMWFQQSSREQLPRKYRIEGTATALRKLGYTVEVEVDTTPRDMAEQEADRDQRLADRAEALDAKAERRQRESAGRQDAADQVFDNIPMGQPILIGHHSEKADRRRRARASNNQRKAIELQKEARRAAERAAIARRYVARRNSPRQVLSRIKALETELGKVTLYLTEGTLGHGWDEEQRRVVQVRVPTTSPGTRVHWETEKAHLENQLDHWRKIHESHLADGRITVVGPDDVSVGDNVLAGGLWREVVRVNRKSVTVNNFQGASGAWITGTVLYHTINKVRPSKPEPVDLDQH